MQGGRTVTVLLTGLELGTMFSFTSSDQINNTTNSFFSRLLTFFHPVRPYCGTCSSTETVKLIIIITRRLSQARKHWDSRGRVMEAETLVAQVSWHPVRLLVWMPLLASLTANKTRNMSGYNRCRQDPALFQVLVFG